MWALRAAVSVGLEGSGARKEGGQHVNAICGHTGGMSCRRSVTEVAQRR